MLEGLVVIFLALGCFMFWRASQSSEEMMAHELRAMATLQAIQSTQQSFQDASGRPMSASLAELVHLCRAGRLPGRGEGQLAGLQPLPEHPESVFRDESYLYILYRAQVDGTPQCDDNGASNLHSRFWIAYAWPDDYGVSGRRVFVMDSFGLIRSWDNFMKGEPAFTGPGTLPPAHLAPAPPGCSYPFASKILGIMKHNRWVAEEVPLP